MFNHLRSKKELFLFIFACALLSASTSYADTNKQTIGTTAAQNITSTTAKFTGAGKNVSGTADQEALAVNDITINYDGSLTDGLRTSGTVNMTSNVLGMEGGTRLLTGDNTAAKLTINNNNGKTNANLSNFNFNLTGNTVSMNAKLGNSKGNIYGAVLQSNDSGVGNATVTGNSIVIGSAADTAGVNPTMTGALLHLQFLRLTLTKN